MNNSGLAKFFVTISIIILVWIILQFAMYTIEVPDAVKSILSFFINFNLVFFILLPIFLFISILLMVKKNKLGVVLVVINTINAALFFFGDFIVK